MTMDEIVAAIKGKKPDMNMLYNEYIKITKDMPKDEVHKLQLKYWHTLEIISMCLDIKIDD